MNKADLIRALAKHYDGSKTEAARALNAVVETITFSTAAGEKVSITGFGVFEKVSRGERMVRNPRTGERKKAEPTAVPRFRPGTDLKAYVSGAKPLPTAGAKPLPTTASQPADQDATANNAEPEAASIEKTAAERSADATSVRSADRESSRKATASK